MGTSASLLDLIAHGGSLRASQDNEQQAAQTKGIQANTGLTNAQVPLVNQQTEQEKIKTQLAQRQLHDEEIQRQIWADAGKQLSTPPPQPGGPVSVQPPQNQQPMPQPQGQMAPQAAGAPSPPAPPQAAAPPDYLSNPRAYAMELAKRGASAPAVMAAYTQGITLNTNLAKLTKDQLENETAGHALVADSLQGYLNAPTPQAYQQFYADAITREPNLKSELPPPGGAPSQDDLAHVIGKVHLFGTLLANAKEKQATATSAAQEKEAGAATARTEALTPFEAAEKDFTNQRNAKILAGTNAQGLTADQQANLKREGESQAETARHNKQTEFAAQREVALKQKQFDATFGSGLDVDGRPLSPEAAKAAALQDPTAQAIAHYQIQGPPAQTRGGAPSPILRKVLAINPDYDGTQFAARNKVQQDFSAAGASGKLITSADTALAHLDSISKAGEALNNMDVPQLNRLANAVGAQVGQTSKQTYDTIISMVAPEISKAVIGAAGGETERQKMEHNFSSNASPAQREGAIAAAAGLLGARIHKQAQAYQSSIGAPLDLEKRLSPESQAVMKKYSGGTAGPKLPAVGAIEDGHKFKGGNPADPKSWEVVK